MNFVIKKCTQDDAESFTKHCILHMQEKGIGGKYVHPFSSSHNWEEKDFLENLIKKWSLKPFSPNWEVAWVACRDDKFLGHINLRCGPIDALKHRMRLGMGIEVPYRSLGIGKALVKTAIDWCRQQEEIAWIDLSVFSSNSAAQKLYLNHGFQITHTMEDALRIDGESYDDVQMVLKV